MRNVFRTPVTRMSLLTGSTYEECRRWIIELTRVKGGVGSARAALASVGAMNLSSIDTTEKLQKLHGLLKAAMQRHDLPETMTEEDRKRRRVAACMRFKYLTAVSRNDQYTYEVVDRQVMARCSQTSTVHGNTKRSMLQRASHGMDHGMVFDLIYDT